MRIRQRQGSGTDGQQGREGIIDCGHFDLLGSREHLGQHGAHRKHQHRILRQLLGVAQGDVAGQPRLRGLDVLRHQRHARARCIDPPREREHPAVLERDFHRSRIARLQGGHGLHVARHHRQFLRGRRSGEAAGRKRNAVEGQAGDLIQARPGERSDHITGVDDEASQVGRFAEGAQCDLLRVRGTELGDEQGHRTGRGILQRQFDFDRIGLDRLPVDLELLAGAVLEHDVIDTADTVRGEVNGALAPDHQRALVARGQCPGLASGIDQVEGRRLVEIKSPVPVQGADHRIAEARRAQRAGVDHEATLPRIRRGRQFHGAPVAAGKTE